MRVTTSSFISRAIKEVYHRMHSTKDVEIVNCIVSEQGRTCKTLYQGVTNTL